MQQLEQDLEHELVPNWERSSSRLHIVSLLIWLLCKVHYVKCQAGWSTSWNQDWGEISITSDMRMTPPAESKEELNSLLMKVKEKSDLKLNIQKKKIMASSPIIAWQILFSWAPKSLQMVTAAVKLKDTCSLEEKLWETQTVYFKSRDITWLTKVHLVKTVVFSGVRTWELDHKEGWAWRRQKNQ